MGPRYVASQSGAFMKQTSHLAYLLMQRCQDQEAVTVEGRRTRPNKITIVETQDINFKDVRTGPSLTIHARDGFHKYIAFFPIATSVATCMFCAWDSDLYYFSLILLNILANGISCLVIGSASIVLKHIPCSMGAPPGDGMLMDGNNVVVMLEKEKDVVAITRGKFQLDYKPWVRMRIRRGRRKRNIIGDRINNTHRQVGKKDAESGRRVESHEDDEINNEYAATGFCSLLLVLQFVTQPLLIPQGTLFGQVMFLTSFAASWAHNLFLTSTNKEYLQEEVLLQALGLSGDRMKTYKLGTRATAAVFTCLVLQPKYNSGEWETRGCKPQEIIRQFIPNDTQVRAVWRDQVLDQMKSNAPDWKLPDRGARGGRVAGFSESERLLLLDLLSDARTAYQQHSVLQAQRLASTQRTV
ncbi:hypothetical protein AZE42_09672 [Rhizopogon vesiculosus]|uniref:Uncharacterized protein n=1 Tax=Rhizopogon vesiculosus TaxID=180088 RepID=A0A1J8PYI0_9AGAM|nr:hypothetical protein AZE42_09672 [Rhizopogon vesiculosus]